MERLHSRSTLTSGKIEDESLTVVKAMRPQCNRVCDLKTQHELAITRMAYRGFTSQFSIFWILLLPQQFQEGLGIANPSTECFGLTDAEWLRPERTS